jgi:hypothetical protein
MSPIASSRQGGLGANKSIEEPGASHTTLYPRVLLFQLAYRRADGKVRRSLFFFEQNGVDRQWNVKSIVVDAAID